MYNSELPLDFHRVPVKHKKRKNTDYIVVHCSATQNLPKYDWRAIDQMHRQRGFLSIGYHYVILTDGTIQNGRDFDEVGAHAVGFNSNSIGICLIGGVDKRGNSVDNFTKEQKASLRDLIDTLIVDNILKNVIVLGHRDLPKVAKDCPCFDVKEWYGKQPKDKFYEKVNNDESYHEISLKFDVPERDLEILNEDNPSNLIQLTL